MVDELLQIDNERKYELLNLKINLTNNDELDKLFFEYSKKYLYSANLINEYLINDSNDIYELDIYFYSMMYLYRHSI